jgi:hypothetical protein
VAIGHWGIHSKRVFLVLLTKSSCEAQAMGLWEVFDGKWAILALALMTKSF